MVQILTWQHFGEASYWDGHEDGEQANEEETNPPGSDPVGTVHIDQHSAKETRNHVSIVFFLIGPSDIQWNFRKVNFQCILVAAVSYEIVPRWRSMDITDDKTTLVQVMAWYITDDKTTLVQVIAWCRQATSHYLTQCWPKSKMLYSATRPQWVNKKSNFNRFIVSQKGTWWCCHIILMA